MRLIDADKLKDAISTKDGVNEETWEQLYDSIMVEIDNAPTIEGFAYEDEYGLVGVYYEEVVIERTYKDEDGKTYQELRICGEAQNE